MIFAFQLGVLPKLETAPDLTGYRIRGFLTALSPLPPRPPIRRITRIHPVPLVPQPHKQPAQRAKLPDAVAKANSRVDSQKRDHAGSLFIWASATATVLSAITIQSSFSLSLE